MKRLRDQGDSPDANIARAAQLVSAVRPLQILDARVRWARRRLNNEPRRRSWRSLRPAAALLFVFGIAATAGAAYETGKYLVSEYFVPEVTVASTSTALQEPAKRPTSSRKRGVAEPAVADPAVEPTAADSTAVESTAVAEPNTEPSASNANPALKRRSIPTSRVSASNSSTNKANAAAEKPSLESEAALVQRGMQALRQEKDAQKAAKILREYEAKNPNGALAEEALVLSIEAASASNDPRAAELASWYLSRYPQGRFRDVAQRALAKRVDR